MNRLHLPIVLLLLAILPTGANLFSESLNTLQLYLDGRFNEIIQYFRANEFRQDFQALTETDKLLYIECLARISRGNEALSKLTSLLTPPQNKVEILATAAIVYFSLGQFSKSESYLQQAELLPEGTSSKRVKLTKLLLSLYQRQFSQALEQYENLLKADNQWKQSDLMFLLGLDLYRAIGDSAALGNLYKTHSGRKYNSTENRKENLNADAKIYKKTGPMFRVETKEDKIRVPFDNHTGNLRVNTIAFTMAGKTFHVLLDTGNATGWTVHNKDLQELLDAQKGSRTLTKIGVVSGLLAGFRYFYPEVDANLFILKDIDGVYVPKPYVQFPDANLNPLFITNRVITLDFSANEMILSTAERFQKDIQELLNHTPEEKIQISRLPWIGYKDALIPIQVNEHDGLGLLETGADDIALKEHFARFWHFPLVEKKRVLPDGGRFKYFLTSALVKLGALIFKRDTAEVWGLERFYHPITGVAPDVIIGPKALMGLSVSFDPFTREVIVIQR